MRVRFYHRILACAAASLVMAGVVADELRDPTRPPQPKVPAPQAARATGPVLSAVLSFEGRRTAIFDGRLVRAGSVVGPYTIEAVLADGVRYRRASEMYELHLPRAARVFKKAAGEPPAASEVAP